MERVFVIKKDGTKEPFSDRKLLAAVHLSAQRADVSMSADDDNRFLAMVKDRIQSKKVSTVSVKDLHNYVEIALDTVNRGVADSYRNYRNYRKELANIFEDCSQYSLNLLSGREKENANQDSDLVAVKQALTRAYFSKQMYMLTFLSRLEKEAQRDGYIYVHDMSARRDTFNCSLFDLEEVLNGGFRMANMWYTEPNSLATFFDVTGDIVLSAASQQYGGFTLPEIDKVMEKYCVKSANNHMKHALSLLGVSDIEKLDDEVKERVYADVYAQVERELEQGLQGWEYKFNTVGSSRGDYPFTTLTFGLNNSFYGKMICKKILQVRRKGQGGKHKVPVLFPKLVFLYDEKLHGEGGEMEDVFEEGLKCSMQTMYPDWLSMSGNGYIASMYKQYGKVVSPMGCRAFLSPWYEKGGMQKADETDTPIFVGRFNIGVISLNLPMIYKKSMLDGVPFFETLDYYLEMIRQLHLRTYAYLGEMKASSNPLAFCEGGFLGGHLLPDDKIEPLLRSATASFGITALNELSELAIGKPLHVDSSFALETLQHINKVVDSYKQEDGRLYAIYGTPAENLCGLQVKQYVKKYGVEENVSDKEWVSNSFHACVTADITPIEKQDVELPFWELCNGGKIQYCKYPIDYNIDAVRVLIRRAMRLGYYEGVNLSPSFCNDCGARSVALDYDSNCPCCGSENITRIDRMNGYLAYSKLSVKNSDGTYSHYSRLSAHKDAEIRSRKSM